MGPLLPKTLRGIEPDTRIAQDIYVHAVGKHLKGVSGEQMGDAKTRRRFESLLKIADKLNVNAEAHRQRLKTLVPADAAAG